MRILLVKPRPEADQFGLAPFFQTEPLGLEYIAAALNQHKHSSTIIDMRFERRRLDDILKRVSPDIVGISCLHSLDHYCPANASFGADKSLCYLELGVDLACRDLNCG